MYYFDRFTLKTDKKRICNGINNFEANKKSGLDMFVAKYEGLIIMPITYIIYGFILTMFTYINTLILNARYFTP